MRRGLAAVCLCLVAGLSQVEAKPLLWTLYGVTYADGATVSGSYDYDADTNTFSAISITSTAGDGFQGATYTAVSPAYGAGSGGGSFVIAGVSNYTGLSLLSLALAYPMIDAGGAFPLQTTEYLCSDAACDATNGTRTTLAGYVSTLPIGAAAVLEPASPALLGSGLAVLWLLGNRRRLGRT